MSNTFGNAAGNPVLEIYVAQYIEKVVWNCNQVIHPSWLFYWNPAPGARIIAGNQVFEADEKFAYLIPPYTTISGFSQVGFPHLYCHFNLGKTFDNVRKQIYQLDAAPARKFFEENLSCNGVRQQLFWQILILEYLAMLPDEAWLPDESMVDARIRKALDFISKNWHKKLDIQQLAKAAGMSENNFYRRFREVMQITPGRYLLSMRLNMAHQMLQDSDVSIEETALKCGFADRYCFSKAFKQFFGITPGAFKLRSEEKI